MKIKGFIKNTFIEYPGKIAAMIFLPSCNFRCSFCFNPELILESDKIKDVDEKEVFGFLEKQKKWIDAVVFSIAGDEHVIIKNSETFKHVPIKELWDEARETTAKREPITYECQTVDFECLTKEGFKPAKEIIRHKTKELWKITATPGNYNIKLTNAHSIFTLTKDGLCSKKVNELKIGDFVLSPKGEMLENTGHIEKIDLLEYVSDVIELNKSSKQKRIKYWKQIIKQLENKSISQLSREIGHTRSVIRRYRNFFKGNLDLLEEWIVTNSDIRHKTSRVKIPRFIPVTEELCRFLGYAAAEGCPKYTYLKSKKRVESSYQFSLGNELPLARKILDLYHHIFKSESGAIMEKHKNENVQYDVIVGNILISKFISELIGKGFINKHIPTIVFNAANENKIAFLKALAEGDGHHRVRHDKSQQEFSIKTSSPSLCADVIFLAKTLGAFAWLEEDEKNKSFRIVISSNSLNKLNIEKRIKTLYTFDTRVSGIPKPLIGYAFRGQKRLAREKLKKWLSLDNFTNKQKALAIRHGFLTKKGNVTCKSKRLQFLYNLTKNWDIKEIKSIKRIKLKHSEYVYDLVVPNNHSFVGGTGSLLLHNSGGEPTLHKDLPDFIKKTKKMGFLVRIYTNGSNPEMLKQLIDKKLIDSIAMDIKAPLTESSYEAVTNVKGMIENVKKSISLIMCSDLDYEFRTTVVPSLHSEKDIEEIAKYVKDANLLVLQKFLPENALDNKLKKLKTQNDEEMEKLANIARKYVKNVSWR